MSRRLLFRLFALLLTLLVIAPVSWAGQWRTRTGLSLDTTYTDNKNLSHNDKKGEISLGVTPSVGVTGSGGRFNLDALYSPGLRIRSGNSPDVSHNLSSSIQSELYKDVFFLDASANARQALKDAGGRNGGGDNINNNDDTTQTFNYSVSPYTRHHYGNYADSVLGYTFSQVINNSSDTEDSIGHSFYYNMDSGSRFNAIPWSVSASFNQVDYDDGGDDSKTYHLEGNSSYVLSRIWSIDGYGFYDKYDIETNRSNDAGFGGGAGFTWTPSTRTYLKTGYGYRVLSGWNLYFDFSHRSRRSTWTAKLTHDVESSRGEQLAQQTFDEDGNPIFNPDSPDLTSNEYYVYDRFNTGYTYQGRRNTLSASLYASKRVGEVTDDEQRSYGASAAWRHGITPQTSSNVRVSWDRTDYDDSNSSRSRNNDNSDRDTWTISTGLTHRLGQHTDLLLDLRHLNRTADRSSDEYDENRVSLTLRMRWN